MCIGTSANNLSLESHLLWNKYNLLLVESGLQKGGTIIQGSYRGICIYQLIIAHCCNHYLFYIINIRWWHCLVGLTDILSSELASTKISLRLSSQQCLFLMFLFFCGLHFRKLIIIRFWLMIIIVLFLCGYSSIQPFGTFYCCFMLLSITVFATHVVVPVKMNASFE